MTKWRERSPSSELVRSLVRLVATGGALWLLALALPGCGIRDTIEAMKAANKAVEEANQAVEEANRLRAEAEKQAEEARKEAARLNAEGQKLAEEAKRLNAERQKLAEEAKRLNAERQKQAQMLRDEAEAVALRAREDARVSMREATFAVLTVLLLGVVSIGVVRWRSAAPRQSLAGGFEPADTQEPPGDLDAPK